MSLYFVAFLVVGSFLVLNLLVAITIEKFSELQSRHLGYNLFLTPLQQVRQGLRQPRGVQVSVEHSQVSYSSGAFRASGPQCPSLLLALLLPQTWVEVQRLLANTRPQRLLMPGRNWPRWRRKGFKLVMSR
jgi:voltage-dependent calcium channel L type alpha-1D